MTKNNEAERGHQATERNIYGTERIKGKVHVALGYPCLSDGGV